MLLLRKIDETRWFNKEFLETTSVTDLNAADNELSAWMDDGSVSDLDLALAFILTQSSFKTICCIKIPDNALNDKKIQLRQQNSSTPYINMRPYHTNILVPTIVQLADLAEIIYNLIRTSETNYKFFAETDLKIHFYNTLVQNAIEIDFTSKKQYEKWRVIKEMQESLGAIDFTRLTNVIPK